MLFFFSVLVEMLKEHQSIILGPKKKPRTQVLTIDEEELEEEFASGCSEEILMEEDIDGLVNEMMEKYCFKKQVEESVAHLGILK